MEETEDTETEDTEETEERKINTEKRSNEGNGN
jgi:hypothetical protein